MQYLKGEYGQEQDGINAWCQRWIGDGLAACEALLKRQNDGRDFCFGDQPGMGDVYLMPQVFSAGRFNVDLTAMPNINRIVENCAKLDAFDAAHPSKQPDAE